MSLTFVNAVPAHGRGTRKRTLVYCAAPLCDFISLLCHIAGFFDLCKDCLVFTGSMPAETRGKVYELDELATMVYNPSSWGELIVNVGDKRGKISQACGKCLAPRQAVRLLLHSSLPGLTMLLSASLKSFTM